MVLGVTIVATICILFLEWCYVGESIREKTRIHNEQVAQKETENAEKLKKMEEEKESRRIDSITDSILEEIEKNSKDIVVNDFGRKLHEISQWEKENCQIYFEQNNDSAYSRMRCEPKVDVDNTKPITVVVASKDSKTNLFVMYEVPYKIVCTSIDPTLQLYSLYEPYLNNEAGEGVAYYPVQIVDVSFDDNIMKFDEVRGYDGIYLEPEGLDDYMHYSIVGYELETFDL